MSIKDNILKPSRRAFLHGSAKFAVAAGGFVAAPALLRSAWAQDKPMVALVHSQPAGDNGPIDEMIEAVKRIESEIGATVRVVYAADPATFDAVFRTLGNAGASVVAASFFAVAQALKAVAPSYPNTKFIHLYADPADPTIGNLKTVSYDQYLADYLSGIYGAKVSKTGSVGYIGGASVPTLNADFNALKAGALSVSDAVKVVPAFVGSFQDPAKAREIASQMFQSGVDYVQCGAAGSNAGIIQAANEGAERIVAGSARANTLLAPKTMHTTIAVNYGLSLYNELKAALASEFKGGHERTNMSGGVVDFALSDVFLKEGEPAAVERAKAIFAELAPIKQAIIDGKIDVPFNTTI
jgi:basic membrane protein A